MCGVSLPLSLFIPAVFLVAFSARRHEPLHCCTRSVCLRTNCLSKRIYIFGGLQDTPTFRRALQKRVLVPLSRDDFSLTVDGYILLEEWQAGYRDINVKPAVTIATFLVPPRQLGGSGRLHNAVVWPFDRFHGCQHACNVNTLSVFAP